MALELIDVFSAFGKGLMLLFNNVLNLITSFGSASIDVAKFILDIFKEIVKLLPTLKDIFILLAKLLKKGIMLAKLLVLFAPLIGVLYYTIYIIQILERRY